MGKINKGILGGFSGRVGNVIGASWKGIDYMRSEATSISDPKTTKQLAQRNKFVTCVPIARAFLPIINIGYKKYATKRSQFNYFVSLLTTTYWNAQYSDVDFDNLQVSAGVLPLESGITVRKNTQGEQPCVEFRYPSYNVDYDTNWIIAVVYDADSNTIVYNPLSGDVERSALGVDVYYPNEWAGDELNVFLFFYDPNTKECSPTFVSIV